MVTGCLVRPPKVVAFLPSYSHALADSALVTAERAERAVTPAPIPVGAEVALFLVVLKSCRLKALVTEPLSRRASMRLVPVSRLAVKRTVN